MVRRGTLSGAVASIPEVARRALVLVVLAMAVVAASMYVRSTRVGGEGFAGRGPLITLRAQKGGGWGQAWTTTRRVSVSCGAHPAASASEPRSARSLCEALAYYAGHLRASVGPMPCAPALVPPDRVVIAGRLYGHPVRLVMEMVCNPTPALRRAVHTIDAAAFK
jgi:hypothetical protein